ncbi:hypothetical protein KW835_12635 [Acidovorax sp. sic0104]|nr:hypothetical protein [Acidovorax sp. sic0104]
MCATRFPRDAEYRVAVNGATVLQGSPHDIGLLFFKLIGMPFVGKPNGSESHAKWLATMNTSLVSKLGLGHAVEMFNPEGKLLDAGAIGDSLATAPVVEPAEC